jgi:hypothetical protein
MSTNILSINLGPTPRDEQCAQVGQADYEERSLIETRVYKRLLARVCPVPPGVSARLKVSSFRHDFGTYREVTVLFDLNDEKACSYASELEKSAPARWDEIALAEFVWFEHRKRYASLVLSRELAPSDVPALYRQAEPPASYSGIVTAVREPAAA